MAGRTVQIQQVPHTLRGIHNIRATQPGLLNAANIGRLANAERGKLATLTRPVEANILDVEGGLLVRSLADLAETDFGAHHIPIDVDATVSAEAR